MDDAAFEKLDLADAYMRNWSRFIRAKAASCSSAEEAANFRRMSFIAPQSLRSIMLTVQGFRGFAADFFQRHPGSYLPPLRFSSSYLESFFGEARAGSGDAGKALAALYATAVSRREAAHELKSTKRTSKHLRPAK